MKIKDYFSIFQLSILLLLLVGCSTQPQELSSNIDTLERQKIVEKYNILKISTYPIVTRYNTLLMNTSLENILNSAISDLKLKCTHQAKYSSVEECRNFDFNIFNKSVSKIDSSRFYKLYKDDQGIIIRIDQRSEVFGNFSFYVFHHSGYKILFCDYFEDTSTNTSRTPVTGFILYDENSRNYYFIGTSFWENKNEQHLTNIKTVMILNKYLYPNKQLKSARIVIRNKYNYTKTKIVYSSKGDLQYELLIDKVDSTNHIMNRQLIFKNLIRYINQENVTDSVKLVPEVSDSYFNLPLWVLSGLYEYGPYEN